MYPDLSYQFATPRTPSSFQASVSGSEPEELRGPEDACIDKPACVSFDVQIPQIPLCHPNSQASTHLSTALPLQSLAISRDDLATCSFFQNVFSTDEVAGLQPSRWMMNSKMDAPVTHAIRACGMTVVINREHCAQEGYDKVEYARALAAIQSKLADPALATDDTTLFAVLLLSVYESLQRGQRASKDCSQASAWKSHAEGIASLLPPKRTRESTVTIWGMSILHCPTADCDGESLGLGTDA